MLTARPVPTAAADRPRRRGRTRWLVGGLFVLGLALVGGAVLVLGGAETGLDPDATALAHVSVPWLGAQIVRASAIDAHGRTVPVAVHGTLIVPTHQVAAGERLRVAVVTKRTGALSWLPGGEQHASVTLRTPRATVVHPWTTLGPDGTLRVGFSAPVRTAAVDSGGHVQRIALTRPTRHVSLGHRPATGTIAIAAVPRTWERLPRATTVTWFPHSSTPTAIVSPAAGSRLTPSTQIRVTYSTPLAKLHHQTPTLTGSPTGRWTRVDRHTLRFRPSGDGYGLGQNVQLTLPAGVHLATGTATAQSVAWTVPPGSTLRLQQLLADQGYLPLSWSPAGDAVARTTAAQLRTAVDPPAGSFSWRWSGTPSELRALWHPGSPDEITHGALMAFESDHGLTVDGLAGPAVWKAIIAAEIAGTQDKAGYSYVLVHRDVPQSLTLYHDGKQLLTTPANTGVPAAPTQLGTFPVYQRLASQTMTGTNPDGSKYSDPGIKWISYFNGGDAIHGFDRGSYGTPQSVGCVELPIPTAAKVWPHTPIGTLVTIAH